MAGITKKEREQRKAEAAAKAEGVANVATEEKASETADNADTQAKPEDEVKTEEAPAATAQQTSPEAEPEPETESTGNSHEKSVTKPHFDPALPASSNGMRVYCKLPSGMKFPTPFGEVSLKGSSASNLVNGYGCTLVPQDAWEYIQKVYGKMKVFDKLNPVIFAASSTADGESMAKEFGANVKTGLEKKNPKDIVVAAERKAGIK